MMSAKFPDRITAELNARVANGDGRAGVTIRAEIAREVFEGLDAEAKAEIEKEIERLHAEDKKAYEGAQQGLPATTEAGQNL